MDYDFEDVFSRVTWENKYKDERDKTVKDTWRRVAKKLASVEKDKNKWQELFYNILSKFNTMGGRTLANLGTSSRGTSEFNCFVLNARLEKEFAKKGIDSMESIMFMLKELALTLKGEGGYGSNCSFLRPRGTYISGIKSETPGAVEMLDMWNAIADVITRGAGTRKDKRAKKAIRKGAMMIVINCWHPDLEEFITAKQVSGRLTKFNMSVGLTDRFMKSVEADLEWDLIFPDVECKQYDKEWDGDIEKWKSNGYPIKIYKTVKAKELYNKIMKSTYNRAEPGVIFLDRINELNNLRYCEYIQNPNPCVTGDTPIQTTEGIISIEEMANEHKKSGKIYDVYCMNRETGELEIKQALKVFKTKEVDTLMMVRLSNGKSLRCTPDHEIYIDNDIKLSVSEIKDILFPDTKQKQINNIIIDKSKIKPIYFQRTKANEKHLRVKLSTQKNYIKEHRFVANYYYELHDCDDVHHIDNNSFNNKYDNLEVLPHGSHSIISNEGHTDWSNRDEKTGIFLQKPIKIKKTSVTSPSELLTSNGFDKLVIETIDEVNLNEPMSVFDMTVEEHHNYIASGIVISNCGEQPLPSGGICNLGSLNLMNYVNKKRDDWDYEKLSEDIPIHIRMLDNVNSVGKAPLKIQNNDRVSKRRVGQGILGYASALMYMKIPYGSPRALKLTEEFCKFWVNTAYKASALLAKEKGAFPLYNKEKYLQSKFLKILDKDTIDLIEKHGMRNSHLLSIAPTGNSSVYANIVSGGIEPIFNAEYIRTVITNEDIEGLKIYRKTDIEWDNIKNEYEAYKSEDKIINWEWFKEGDEYMLKIKHNDKIYKIDRNRGLTQEVLCMDQSVRKLKMLNEWDSKAEWALTGNKLKISDHIETMKIFAKYVDSALSKTVNLHHSYSFSDFKDLYISAWKTGFIKGLTTYREGTMGSVLKEAEINPNGKEIIVKDHISLPRHSPSETFTLESEGKKWYITTCYWPAVHYKKPFALFVKTNSSEKNALMKNAYEQLFELVNEKGIKKSLIDDQVNKAENASPVDKVMRMVSLNLRHGVHIKNIVAAIEKCEPTVGTLLFHVKKYLESFIADGVKTDVKCPACGDILIYSEGCKKCSSCSYSAC